MAKIDPQMIQALLTAGLKIAPKIISLFDGPDDTVEVRALIKKQDIHQWAEDLKASGDAKIREILGENNAT